MPLPKAFQKGKDKGCQQQKADMSVCGLCASSFADEEERIESGRFGGSSVFHAWAAKKGMLSLRVVQTCLMGPTLTAQLTVLPA